MQVMERLRRMQANGAGRVVDAVSDWQTPWARRRRTRRVRRVLWMVGFALGLLAVAGLVLGVIRGQEEMADDEE